MDPSQNSGQGGATVPRQPQQDPVQPNPLNNNQLSNGSLSEDNRNVPGGVQPFYDQYPTAHPNDEVKTDPWAGDFQNQPDPNAVKAADADIAKFDPTPADPLSITDLYGEPNNWQQYDQGKQNLQAGVKAEGMAAALGNEEARLAEIKKQLGAQISGPHKEMEIPVSQEQYPVLEVAKVPEVKEIHEAGETGVEAIHKEHIVLPTPVVHEGETLVSNVEPDKVKIEVPITQTTYQSGFKMNITYALRWLVESIRKLTLKGDKEVAFKAN